MGTTNNSLRPVTIVKDRYNGEYLGGMWTAWNDYVENIPLDIGSDGVTCGMFWQTYEGIFGKGDTPEQAYNDLVNKLNGKKIISNIK